ncbi:MAG: RagB/SusD family nutrient uptake outer membrane protein [Bacteroidales bacterium]|nr:RagB/SusD family nutrient uptake outer membrane protein [Bacteroidales bacterium]
MKRILPFLLPALLSLASCDLDLYPFTSYNEGNVEMEEEQQYSTREEMQGLRNSLYSSWIKDIQEKDWCDWLIYSEVRADNAYNGSPSTGELVAIEANKIDGDNKNVKRDWDWYLYQVSNANQIICNIDQIPSSQLPTAERNQWKAEALIWRAYCLFRMSMLWGDIPVVTVIPPAITAENIEQVYHAYYPVRQSVDVVYERIIEDLEFGVRYAPAVDPANKFLLSKAFANGLLARVYAEKPRQDWEKVAEYCQTVEGMGFRLVDNYADLWGYDENDAWRNSSESIFEVTWSRSVGNWVWMMFHRNAWEPDDSYTWQKWVTPSRDLIAAYEAENDTRRLNASVVTDACGWSNYYPETAYKFMNKVPTNASSCIMMRLAEIYLLHAEALTMTDRLEEAAAYVNLVRERAGLSDLPASAMADRESMLEAVLHERRLELAFEGFRFFDLARHGKAAQVCDAVVGSDSYWQPRVPLTDETILLPVSQEALDTNPSLTQNPGY